MNTEHTKHLIRGSQLRGQSGQQLFLVISLRQPSVYYFTGQYSVIGQLFFMSTKQKVLSWFSTVCIYSFKGPALKCQQAIKETHTHTHILEVYLHSSILIYIGVTCKLYNHLKLEGQALEINHCYLPVKLGWHCAKPFRVVTLKRWSLWPLIIA